MKKLLSILLCFVMMFGLLGLTASAQGKNLCDEFKIIEWFETCYNEGTKNQNGFSEKIIHKYIADSLVKSGEYTAENNRIYVPAKDYEDEVDFWFNTSSSTINNIRALYYKETFDIVTEETDDPVFTNNTYVINTLNDSSYEQKYFLEGYVKRNGEYGVYLNLRNKVDSKPDGVLGKDYFESKFEDTTVYYIPTTSWIKYIVTYQNSQIKYLSTDKVTGIPEDIIKPGDKVKETASSSEASSSEETSSTADTSSATPSSVTSSQEETSTPSVIQVHTVAKVSGAELRAAKGVFPENTAFSISPITEGVLYDTAKTALGDTAQRFVAFNISAASNGMAVQPNGTVTAVFDVPEGYDILKLAVIYVSEDGKTEILSSIVDKKSNTITAELPHFSTFVVAEMVNETNVDVKERSNAGLIVLIIILVILLLAGIAFLVWFFVFYKKKGITKKKPEPDDENDDDMLIFP